MMQVCGAWYDILASTVWSKITSEDWYIRRFPRHAAKTPLLCRALRHIRSLEWCNPTVMGFENRRMQSRQVVPQDTIAMFITTATHLDSLAINASGSAALPCYMKTISELRSLKKLTIDHEVHSSRHRIPFQKLKQILANLDEFNTWGQWFSYNEPLNEVSASWRLRKMSITLDEFCLLPFCPRLEELQVSTGLAHNNNRDVSFEPLKSCPELTALRSCHSTVTDLVEVLAALKKLQSLDFITTTSREIAAIAEEPDNNNPLPELAHLEIHPNHLSRSDAQKFDTHLSQILAMRTKLKTITVDYHPVNLASIFGNSDQYWACEHLETIELEIEYVSNRAERGVFWEAAFRQFGQLASLKSLCLRSSGFGSGWNAGVNHLEGAQKLEQMTLCDRSRGIWTQEMLACLFEAIPKLTHLEVTLLHESQTLDILRGWIENAGRDSSILGQIHY
ncbi:hypothetical protein BGX23_003199 [Mortierella sp. AD031]|nr:hypothetical protein BGX23_003199 [Mortierella sp. AD031]